MTNAQPLGTDQKLAHEPAHAGYAKAIRSQADSLGDRYSDETGTDTGTDSLVRQEFADESNLNILLQRYGVDTMSRQPTWGQTVDYNLDLQQALTAIDAARRANLNIPDELRAKYPSWREVLNGAENGALQKDLQDLADRKRTEQNAETEQQEFEKEKTAMARKARAELALKRAKEDTSN